MKRHAALADLSREHHGALSLALKVRKAALAGDPAARAAAGAEALARFAAELEPHFLQEEQWLLPRLVAAGETALADRTLAEHCALRAAVKDLQGAGAAALQRFAELLAAHVRFEERELFERVQALPGPICRPSGARSL